MVDTVSQQIYCSQYTVILLQISQQPYHPAAQDWLPTEAMQRWARAVPGWETSWEN